MSGTPIAAVFGTRAVRTRAIGNGTVDSRFARPASVVLALIPLDSVALAGRKGAETAPDHGIKRLAPARRRAVETAYIAPVAGFGEMLCNEAELPGLIVQTP